MVDKQYVFIDDSGDPGFKDSSSSHFVIACAVFIDKQVATDATDAIRALRRSLGWGDFHEFKFSSTRKDIVKSFIRQLSDFDYKIRAVYIDKRTINMERYMADQFSLYTRTIKELLSRSSVSNAAVRIDGRSNKEYMRRAASYLRKDLNQTTRKIASVRFDDSKNSDLIQLADIAAGSINRSLNPSKTDAQDYIRLLSGKIEDISKIDIL
jgi:hypothetical protein